MNDASALRAVKRGDEKALEWIIDRYSSYVSTIIGNILGGSMTDADIEEVASDVFLILWRNSEKVMPGKLKAFLGALARNKAKEKMRKANQNILLDDDLILISDENPERDFSAKEQARFIRLALLKMPYPEREIFIRHYYYYQTVEALSREMGINPSTAKTKLRRGREKLKEVLLEGGYGVEDTDF